nr:IclR family transcriptional regulator [Microvirga puerhi]
MSREQSKNETSVLKRVSEILNLFSESRPTITLADVEDALGVSQASAYRYVHDLHEIGLLSRTSGRYAPGPKIMELEYIISKFDPVIAASRELMEESSAHLGCHMLLGRLYGNRLVNVYYSRPNHLPALNYSPGRRMPLFRGAQARVILANLDRRRLRRIFETGEGDTDRNKIGADWTSFNAALQRNRREGYYISREELDKGVAGIAAPVFDENGEVLGSISIAYSITSPLARDEERLIKIVREMTRVITLRIAELEDRPEQEIHSVRFEIAE